MNIYIYHINISYVMYIIVYIYIYGYIYKSAVSSTCWFLLFHLHFTSPGWSFSSHPSSFGNPVIFHRDFPPTWASQVLKGITFKISAGLGRSCIKNPKICLGRSDPIRSNQIQSCFKLCPVDFLSDLVGTRIRMERRVLVWGVVV